MLYFFIVSIPMNLLTILYALWVCLVATHAPKQGGYSIKQNCYAHGTALTPTFCKRTSTRKQNVSMMRVFAVDPGNERGLSRAFQNRSQIYCSICRTPSTFLQSEKCVVAQVPPKPLGGRGLKSEGGLFLLVGGPELWRLKKIL